MIGHEKHRQLIDDFNSKKITQDELDKECAYWFMELFSELRIRPIPNPPKELDEYNALPFEKKQKISHEFFQKTAVKSYYDQKSSADSVNKSNLYWLYEFKKHIPLEDVVSIGKYQEKINDLEERLQIVDYYSP